jgi:restriction system protein
MALPNFQMLTLPALRIHADRSDHHVQDTRERLAAEFNLTPEERNTLLPSGNQPVFTNRVAWATVYLKRAGLLEGVSRGVYRITDRGVQVLDSNPTCIDIKFLSQFEGVRSFRTPKRPDGQDDRITTATSFVADTPEEAIEDAFEVLRSNLAAEILEKVKACSPSFFERLVLKVLHAMGYGDPEEDAAEPVGRSGDGGIDGFIKEDKLGFDIICVQAKRWEGVVGSSVVRNFAGSMETVRARKGVIITTSWFSPDAIECVQKIERKIVLIDGDLLARLMVDYGVGVSESRRVVLKKIDSDFFDENAA